MKLPIYHIISCAVLISGIVFVLSAASSELPNHSGDNSQNVTKMLLVNSQLDESSRNKTKIEYCRETVNKLDGLISRLKNILNDYPPFAIGVNQSLEVDIASKAATNTAGKYDYKVNVSISEDDTLCDYRLSVTGKDGKKLFTISELNQSVLTMDETQYFVRRLAKALLAKIAVKYRIKIINFEPFGKSPHDPLAGLIPSLLKNELTPSPQIVLVEEAQPGKPGNNTGSSFDSELNIKLESNYQISGGFGNIEDREFISIEVKNLMTNQIIQSIIIEVNKVDFPVLSKKISAAASEIRESLERDMESLRRQPKSIAVAAIPPTPNYKMNRKILFEMVRVVSRNLAQNRSENVHVRENLEVVKTLIGGGQRIDRWRMSRDLGADILVILDLDRTNLDEYRLYVEIFNPLSPHDVVTLEPIEIRADKVDNKLKDLVAVLVKDLHLSPVTGQQALSYPVSYNGTANQVYMDYRLGLSVRADEDLFANVKAGLRLELGPTAMFTRRHHWSLEFFHLGLDILGAEQAGDKIVVGSDLLLLSLLYQKHPYFSHNPYFGARFGIFGVYRKSPHDMNLDSRPGIGLIFGLQRTQDNTDILDFRLEMNYAFSDVTPTTLDDIEFDGGRPGGILFTIGWKFND